MRKSAYAGITFAFFVVSVLLQWLSGWAELSAGTAPPDKAANIAQFTAGLAREISKTGRVVDSGLLGKFPGAVARS